LAALSAAVPALSVPFALLVTAPVAVLTGHERLPVSPAAECL